MGNAAAPLHSDSCSNEKVVSLSSEYLRSMHVSKEVQQHAYTRAGRPACVTVGLVLAPALLCLSPACQVTPRKGCDRRWGAIAGGGEFLFTSSRGVFVTWMS